MKLHTARILTYGGGARYLLRGDAGPVDWHTPEAVPSAPSEDPCLGCKHEHRCPAGPDGRPDPSPGVLSVEDLGCPTAMGWRRAEDAYRRATAPEQGELGL